MLHRIGCIASYGASSEDLWLPWAMRVEGIVGSPTFSRGVQHNNTTPDDIGICEAYLAFLRGSGDNGAYWAVLDSHGAPTV